MKNYENNEIAKINETNILDLNANFNAEIDKLNLINLLRQINEISLGNYFTNWKYNIIQQFTL